MFHTYKSFQSIPDSLVTVSDSDLKSYINDNSASYQQENSRGIEYVVYSVSPSEEDRSRCTSLDRRHKN